MDNSTTDKEFHNNIASVHHNQYNYMYCTALYSSIYIATLVYKRLSFWLHSETNNWPIVGKNGYRHLLLWLPTANQHIANALLNSIDILKTFNFRMTC